jgi:hypothetical protein
MVLGYPLTTLRLITSQPIPSFLCRDAHNPDNSRRLDCASVLHIPHRPHSLSRFFHNPPSRIPSVPIFPKLSQIGVPRRHNFLLPEWDTDHGFARWEFQIIFSQLVGSRWRQSRWRFEMEANKRVRMKAKERHLVTGRG